LAEFDPYWLPRESGLREKVGIGFTCPVHKDHPVAFYFRHPLDGEPAQPLTPLVEAEDFLAEGVIETFEDLTLYYQVGDTSPLVAGCGAMFWVIGGEVIVKRKREH
jgi:hypothetical protein